MRACDQFWGCVCVCVCVCVDDRVMAVTSGYTAVCKAETHKEGVLIFRTGG